METDSIHQILDWYSNLYSRRVDLIGDFAGSERFLVHGESLLLHCLSDPYIDFDPGFQLLHATYVVEKFLQGLVSRGCNFHIAFFDDHHEFCIPQNSAPGTSEKYRLARTTLIRHLTIHLPSVTSSIDVKTFSSMKSSAFKEYIQHTDIYFILCHDGTIHKQLPKRETLYNEPKTWQTEDPNLHEHHWNYKKFFRALIFHFRQHGYNVALINGLEWRDTKVIATVLESSYIAKREDTEPLSTSGRESLRDMDSTSLSVTVDRIRGLSDRSLTERECLAVIVASKLASPHNRKLIDNLLYHVSLLSEIRLPDRVLDITASMVQCEQSKFILDFCREARLTLESTAWSLVFDGRSACDVNDLFDGRLFIFCLYNSSLKPCMHFQNLQNALKQISGNQICDISSHFQPSVGATSASKRQVQLKTPYSVLPFAEKTFDKHLVPVQLEVHQPVIIDSASAIIFKEVSHWHNKRPINLKSNERDSKIARKVLRRNQILIAEMTAYAASLTNAVGKVLDPEIITIGEKPVSLPAKTTKLIQGLNLNNSKGNSSKGNKHKNAGKETIMASIIAGQQRKDENAAKSYYDAWRVLCATWDEDKKLHSRYDRAAQHLLSLGGGTKRQILEPEIRMYMLNILLETWICICREEAKDKGMHIAALIFYTAKAMCCQPFVTKTVAASIEKTTKQLELPNLLIPKIVGDRKLPFMFALDKTYSFHIGLGSSMLRFQLLHCGPYLDRNFESAYDNRVPFKPDAWQRKVLDAIDLRQSLLVTAPTSAGKTFISFYAMKQILRSNNDDVLVYVAPTKALVNQIAAEIQARFSKVYNQYKTVWGIHTRDYRINNPTSCQILVTVPHILQIMLLASKNAESWSERIKWIIFDEVHCVGQAEDGLIWEQLLIMAPCPIIALSATIGNALSFYEWLESIQRAANSKLVMVNHPHRYSDLRKFMYTQFTWNRVEDCLPLAPKCSFPKPGLDGHLDFAFIHPVTSLSNWSRDLPSDLTLEARDCLTLYESMDRHQTEAFPLEKALKSSMALPDVMSKSDVVKWESALKKVLAEWMANKDSPFQKVLEDLSQPLARSGVWSRKSEDSETKEQEGKASIPHALDSILPLLAGLHQQDALPAIIFNYDRTFCELMCQRILTMLEDAEIDFKSKNESWKKKLRGWQVWKQEKARSKKQSLRGDLPNGMTKHDQMREAADVEVSPYALFDPNEPVEGFHFADSKKLSKEDFQVYASELREREIEEWLIHGLRRGIGVHHSGMNRKYRYYVEILFRKGFLRVVIATGTLALGINMPCKTVVFSGDSVFLTALNFRQASGRAGRRGFDVLGNVVFHRISLNKIHKLISSRLPDLNGHFPLTTTLVLRLFTLLHSSQKSPFAKRCVDSLLSLSRLYLGGEDAKMTVLHHLRFSIEYLRRQSLLDANGIPLNFAGIVSHLYFTENSSFAFHALLKDGYFHQLCAEFDTNPELVKRDLILTMAHLFGRRYCRQADEEFVERIVKKSSSVVFLPPIPSQAAIILQQHNQMTLDIFTGYVCTFVDQHLKQLDNVLPLTKLTIGGASAFPFDVSSAIPLKARSLFVALSGHKDIFTSIHDLCTTVRSDVFLEEAVVPYVGLSLDEFPLPLNAYLYDFFKSGDIGALVTANRIRRGDIWFLLNDFSLVLATIVTSLSNLLGTTSESELDLADVRGGGDDMDQNIEDELLPDDGVDEAGSKPNDSSSRAGTAQHTSLQAMKPKNAIADSWDDELSDEGDDDDKTHQPNNSEHEVPVSSVRHSEASLLNVLKAFSALKQDFDEKFRAMWA